MAERRHEDCRGTAFGVLRDETMNAFHDLKYIKNRQILNFIAVLKECSVRYWTIFVYLYKTRFQAQSRVALFNKKNTLHKLRVLGSLISLYINDILNSMQFIDESLETQHFENRARLVILDQEPLALQRAIVTLRRGLHEAREWITMLGLESGITDMYELSGVAVGVDDPYNDHQTIEERTG
jgi:hypothetical protein